MGSQARLSDPGMFQFKRRGHAAPTDRYVVLSRLGEGGAALVSRSFDRSLCRIVAVKALKENLAAPDLARRTLTREGRPVGYLDHPGIAPIYDHYVKAPDLPCYAMKLVEGKTLSDHLGFRPGKGGRTLPVAEAVGLLLHVGQTLAYAHDRGVIHLDLKPDNVMLGPYGEVLLMDWGNARLVDPVPYRAHLGANATPEDVALLVEEPPDLLSGTPEFMSPEQTCTPRDRLSPSSDIFSSATLFFVMLTGTLPFHGKNVEALLASIRESDAPPLRELNPEVPPRLAAIVAKMLEKDVSTRYATFHEVLEDLRTYQEAGEGFPVQHLQPGEVLFQEGDDGHAAYLVVTGQVEVLKAGPDGEQRLAVLAPGEVVGELAILTREPRSATVRALTETTLRVMDRTAVERELEKIPPWVGTMVSTLAERFLGLNEKLVRRPQEGP